MTTLSIIRDVRCGMCEAWASREFAIESGWVPYHYHGDREVNTPTCPRCAAAHLTVGTDGEVERK